MLQAYKRSQAVAQTVPMRDNLQQKIVFWGASNTFPEQVRQLLFNSGTAFSCVGKLQTFIYGSGVLNEFYSGFFVNESQSLDDFLHEFAEQVSIWNGCAIHISTNLLGQPIAYNIVPYEQLRKGIEGGDFHNKYLVSDNWNLQAADWYKLHKPQVYDAYSLNELDNLESLKEAGESHSGFIHEFRLNSNSVYPYPTFTSVLEDVKADAGASQYRSASAANGFNPSAVFVVDGATIDPQQFLDAIQGVQGSENAGRAFVVDAGRANPSGKFEPQIQLIQPTINKDVSKDQEAAAKLKIINNYNQPKFLHSLDDSGIFSQSGEAISTAYRLYNTTTSRQRRKVENFIDALLSFMPGSANYPQFKIEPLTF